MVNWGIFSLPFFFFTRCMFVLFRNSKKITDNNPILQEILVQISFLTHRHYCCITLLSHSVLFFVLYILIVWWKRKMGKKKKKKRKEQEQLLTNNEVNHRMHVCTPCYFIDVHSLSLIFCFSCLFNILRVLIIDKYIDAI
jgi:hypothetical protein